MMRSTSLMLALSLTACQGYWDAPLQLREELTLQVEKINLHPGAVGTLQLLVPTPENVAPPLFVVGSPEVLAEDPTLTAVAWAYGPCKDWQSHTGGPLRSVEPEVPGLRVCVAVYTPAFSPWDSLYVGLVVDSRRETRRFSAVSEVLRP